MRGHKRGVESRRLPVGGGSSVLHLAIRRFVCGPGDGCRVVRNGATRHASYDRDRVDFEADKGNRRFCEAGSAAVRGVRKGGAGVYAVSHSDLCYVNGAWIRQIDRFRAGSIYTTTVTTRRIHRNGVIHSYPAYPSRTVIK